MVVCGEVCEGVQKGILGGNSEKDIPNNQSVVVNRIFGNPQ